VNIQTFSELLQVLYSAPLQQELWQRFLTRVCEYTNSSLGVFIAADTSTGLAVLAQGGTRDNTETVSAYNQQYAHSDPFRPAVVRRCRTQDPVAVYTEDELIPSTSFLKSEIYRGLLGPAGLRYGTITILACTVRRMDVISLWRTPEEGPISPDARKLMELLIPHVQTALKITRALGKAEQRLASAEAMANASPTATFVLASDGHVQHCNTAAESLIGGNESLTITNGNLSALQPEDRDGLTRLLRNAASPAYSQSVDSQSRASQSPDSPSKSSPCNVLTLHRSLGKRPLQLLAAPLPEAQRQRSRADLLLLVSDPEKPISFPDDILHVLYSLTPAETEVANGLLMGYSPEDIACLRRISASTVRQQIKSMLNKTGTTRQSEMVRLLMTLPQVPAQAI
jgi:DNA-binding CsgD family transcriptional regulator/PAS domain-containing protein